MSVLSWHGPLSGVSRNSISTLSHRSEVTETCPGRENQRILRNHLLEVILQEGEDLLDGAVGLGFDLHPLQGLQGLAGVLGVPAVAEDMPDAMQKSPQFPYLGIGLHDLHQLLLLLWAHPLVGREEEVALLPQGLRQHCQLLPVPRRLDLLAACLDLAPVNQGVPPE